MLRRSHFNGSMVAGGELGGSAIGAPSVAHIGEIRWRRTDSGMIKSQGAFSVATAVLLLAVMTACGSDADPDSTPPPSPSVSETVASPSPSPTSPEDEASASAVEAVTAYYSTIDSLRQDTEAPINNLEAVAVSTQLSAQQKFLASQRNDGLHQVGDTKVIETKIQSVSLDNSDPSAGRVPSVTIDVCWDVSGADLLDTDGKSVVPADRADRGWTRLTVANYSWETDPEGGWRVAGGKDVEKAPCAA